MRESGARCAIHPEAPATHICARCGNFACAGCQGPNSLCPSCRALTGADAFPFNRTNLNLEGLWRYAFEKWKEEWVMLSLGVLLLVAAALAAVVANAIFGAIAEAIVGDRGGILATTWVGGVSWVLSQLLSTVFQGPILLGLIRISIDVLNGRKADLGRLLSQLPKLARYVVQAVVAQLVILVPMFGYAFAMLAIITAMTGLTLTQPDHVSAIVQGVGLVMLLLGMLLALPLFLFVFALMSIASMELVYADTGPIEAIRRALVLVRGFRLSVLGYSIISVLIAITGLIACCAGIIPALALISLLMVAFYLALRNGSELPPPVES